VVAEIVAGATAASAANAGLSATSTDGHAIQLPSDATDTVKDVVVGALVAFLAAGILVRLLSSHRFARLAMDVPNERSLHGTPTPRTGGIGLFLGATVAWVLTGGGALGYLALLTAAISAIFLLDDVRSLSVGVRFAAQFVAAIGFVVVSGLQPLWLLPLLVIGIVWSMNLYNFMDGANGLAGGMAVVGFGAYALGALAGGAVDLAIVSAIVAGAALGFLAWNFDPARIFLGDAGSIPLGFLAAAIGLLGWQGGVWPFWFPLLVFSPFVLDATVTLVHRALRGEKVWQAHKVHYYQRLVGLGWSHRCMALSEYAVMIAAAGSALTLRDASWPTAFALIAVWVAVYAAIALSIDRRWAEKLSVGAAPHPNPLPVKDGERG
jgi:UDP-N-acetylmuramyl pentapeptide phosphotransferase/UDP-N-acetylglucosamine-1-phosphate transferase